MLARSALTEAVLHDRLVAKGYQPETATRTVARCRELGYVSDERLARERARSLRARGAGSLKIVADLTARGVPDRLVGVAVLASQEGESELEWARRALTQAGLSSGSGSRAWRFLLSRGFDADVATEALEHRA